MKKSIRKRCWWFYEQGTFDATMDLLLAYDKAISEIKGKKNSSSFYKELRHKIFVKKDSK